MGAEPLLLVEDDATTRDVLTLLLEAEGWQVTTVESGESALDTLRAEHAKPVAILCDLHLSGMQGAALARALRPLAPEACLLAMSASAEAAEEAAAYEAVLRKPFEPAAVRREVERIGAAKAVAPADALTSPSAELDAHAGPGDLPVIAMPTLLKLEQQMGGRARDLYAFALADAGDRLRRMEASLLSGDADGFRKEAHALKGSAGMIGAERLAALAAGAETAREVTWKGSPDETVRQMRLACDEIRLMLETLFPI